MSDYYNFLSSAHRCFIRKHLLICCLQCSMLDRIFFLQFLFQAEFPLPVQLQHERVSKGKAQPGWAALRLLQADLDVLLGEAVQGESWY